MSTRPLNRLTIVPGPDGVMELAFRLPRVLSGEDPAIAPLPAGPAAYVDRLVETIRPEDPEAPLESDDVAIVLSTSGSMGQPRGVLLTADNLTSAAKATVQRLGGPSRWVLALPCHHVGGMQVLIRSHLSGIPVVPLDSVGGAGKWTPHEFVHATRNARAMADADGTTLSTALVPTQLSRILSLGDAIADTLAAYDNILIGGAAVSKALLDQATRLGGKLTATYGMTETSGGIIYNGEALPGCTAEVGELNENEVGQITLTGPTIALGYRLDPELTEKHFQYGRFLASDLGYFDEGNKLHVVGRSDDLVQIGGLGVSVTAVELTAEEHPDVANVAAVATPDEEWGSTITLFVVPRIGYQLPKGQLAGALIKHIKENLGTNSRPRRVVQLDSLPTLPVGKVDRAQLKEWAANPAEIISQS